MVWQPCLAHAATAAIFLCQPSDVRLTWRCTPGGRSGVPATLGTELLAWQCVTRGHTDKMSELTGCLLLLPTLLITQSIQPMCDQHNSALHPCYNCCDHGNKLFICLGSRRHKAAQASVEPGTVTTLCAASR